MGMRTDEWAKYMHDVLRVPLPPHEIKRKVVERVSARLSQNVPILAGADAALKRLGSDFTLGLATSSAYPIANAVLDAAGWKKYFPVIVSADSVERGKPAPDVYLRTLELLNANVFQTAAIEDSANGIRSAAAAQLCVVAISNREFRPDPSALALASEVLDSLDELRPAAIRSLIANRSVK